MRLIHFSDIHLTTRPLGWSPRDFASRRITGWFNWRALGRWRRFRDAATVAEALVADVAARKPDAVIFTGDASGMGFANEVERTAQALHAGDQAMPPGIAVPGNHDLYTPLSLRSGAFERAFARWQQGERVEGQPYPFARKIGSIWFIAVNSAAPNPRPWDASGIVGAAQRDRLRELLRHLSSGEQRILVTHYPIRLPDGRPETHWHGLRDLDETLRIASDGGVGLWLHGHRHRPYVTLNASIPAVCAGSVAQSGLASYAEISIDGRAVSVLRRVFDPARGQFRDGEISTFGLKA